MESKINKKRILFFGVLPDSITNFRIDLIKLLLKHDFNIEIIVTNPTSDFIKEMKLLNISVNPLNLKRRSYNLTNIIDNYFTYTKIIKKSKPDLVIAYTIKPILIASFYRKLNNQTKLIVMFEGLGTMFDETSYLKIFVKNIFISIYKLIIPKSDSVIFLNQEDKLFFEKLKIVNVNKSFLINGIGINLEYFNHTPLKINQKLNFLFISRLIKEKGVYDFINAAKIVKQNYSDINFTIIGQIENDGISINEIFNYEKEGVINYLGVLQDVRPALKDSSVFVLPTYYNEGLPRTILEALAIGRPIITTNTKGCNQTLHEGQNGFFVEINNPKMLSDIFIKLIADPIQLIKMGSNSRLICEQKFSDKIINTYILNNIILPLLQHE
jgi:glycosyltransferase involved in cell wall biosynthesis